MTPPITHNPRARFVCNVDFKSHTGDVLAAAASCSSNYGATLEDEGPGNDSIGAYRPDAGRACVQPKIMAPFKHAPHEAPREVRVDRLRKLCAKLDPAEELRRAGLDPAAIDVAGMGTGGLALHIFDDDARETRCPSEWVPPTAPGAVGARVLHGAGGAFRRAVVARMSDDGSTCLVQWPALHEARAVQDATHVHRLYVCFDSEDPRAFAARLAAAHAARQAALAALRGALMVDCMPHGDIPQLHAATVRRVMHLALSTAALQAQAKLVDTSGLVTEMHVAHARVQNRIAFAHQLSRAGRDRERAAGALPECEALVPDVIAPRGGPMQHPRRDRVVQVGRRTSEHAAARQAFVRASLETRPEVTAALARVRHECVKVVQKQLFQLQHTSPLRVLDFLQVTVSEGTQNYLRDTFVPNVVRGVTQALERLEKGWYKVHETTYDIYKVSKLRRLLSRARFMMEDTLRSLALNSLAAFDCFMSAACDVAVDVHSASHVELTYGARARRDPLLLVELRFDASSATMAYCDDVAAIPSHMDDVILRAIAATKGLPQIEPLVMSKMHWADQLHLFAAHADEPMIKRVRDRVRESWSAAVVPLHTYCRQCDHFAGILLRDNQEAVRAFAVRGEDLTLADLEAEIRSAEDTLRKLSREVPESVTLGAVLVSASAVRRSLLGAQRDYLDRLVALLQQVPRNLMVAAQKQYKDLQTRLARVPENVEEVDAQRKLIEALPGKIKDILEGAQAAKPWYEALHSRGVLLADDAFKDRAAGECGHVRLWQVVAKVEVDLDAAESSMKGAMQSEQDDFVQSIANLAYRVEAIQSYTDLDKMAQFADDLDALLSALNDAKASAAQFNSREAIFGLPVTDYSGLSHLVDTLDPFHQFWTTAHKWRTSQEAWMHGSWALLDGESVEKGVAHACKTMIKMGKVLRSRDAVECAENAARIKGEVDAFSPLVPLVQSLCSPGMRSRHWDELSNALAIDLHPDESFTLEKVASLGLLAPQRLREVHKIADFAGKEFAIEQALDKMEADWAGVELSIVAYRETGTYVVKVDDAVMQQLDDSIVLAQSMMCSPYKQPFEERITKWERTLSLVSETLDAWLAVQRSWMYLEPIFSSPDIMEQLPAEGKRFAAVDRAWRKALDGARRAPAVLRACGSQKLLDAFLESGRTLDTVQKGLAHYLETKRLAFARFFFLSNDELLLILSQTKDPLAVQPHLRKCFEAIDSLEFSDDLEISAMHSKEGEVMPLDVPMRPTGNVEVWLSEVEARMCASVRAQSHAALEAYAATRRADWVLQWPAMVVIAVSGCYWARGVEEGLAKGDLPGVLERDTADLMDLTDLVRGQLTALQRMTLGALITIDVHARDVVADLVAFNLGSADDFEWAKQLRYYWRDDLYVDMLQASIAYGYEYLGNTPRLVITPLTDRCYMTLMSAMHINLGGAPAGPAGTGKTETTKDLAKALAKQCVVFNCSDGLDYLAMAKFFKGLASSGAWACFDEFNRIDLEVLSVVAQQILTIQLAIMSGVQRFVFEDTEIRLNPACSVYITMNPGYAGRSELPDNLKALFRPCAMMVPDYALIAEICLYSYGYRDAKVLARKMVATFKLCSEQLSSQDHYDYGMRAVKSTITACGNLKGDFPDEKEDVLVLRGLRDINVPKFLAPDLPLFHGIISDLFPGVAPPDVDYTALYAALKEACAEMALQVGKVTAGM